MQKRKRPTICQDPIHSFQTGVRDDINHQRPLQALIKLAKVRNVKLKAAQSPTKKRHYQRQN